MPTSRACRSSRSGPFIRKAQAFYGAFCRLVPFVTVPDNNGTGWDIDRFEWANPAGEPTQLDRFPELRTQRMDELLEQSASERPKPKEATSDSTPLVLERA